MSKPWRFEPEDFNNESDYTPQYAVRSSEVANAKLDEWMREATVVYGASGDGEPRTWYNEGPPLIRGDHPTHRALLINIEPIDKEPCKHEPAPVWSSACGSTVYMVPPEMEYDHRCKHCGVKLKATWEPVE